MLTVGTEDVDDRPRVTTLLSKVKCRKHCIRPVVGNEVRHAARFGRRIAEGALPEGLIPRARRRIGCSTRLTEMFFRVCRAVYGMCFGAGDGNFLPRFASVMLPHGTHKCKLRTPLRSEISAIACLTSRSASEMSVATSPGLCGVPL